MNNVILVGRLVKDLEIRETENNIKVANITIAVTRNYKNANGEYETDFIPCVLWNSIAENTAEYLKKGDMVGIKGRLQSNNILNEDGTIKDVRYEVVAEKVTFLSNKKED